MLSPYYQQDNITIYHGDCRDILPQFPDKSFDLVLTDPPYGMKNNTDSSRFSGGQAGHIAKRGNGGRFSGRIYGDDKPFDPSPFLKFDSVILWGYNHFAGRLPVGSTLVWIKREESAYGTFLSDAELAWMKGGCGVYCRKDLSMTAIANERKHPNEKPVSLMVWCIKKAKLSTSILDPFMGSGTTLVAAKQLGRKAVGIEISEKYCEIAVKRLAQMELFGGVKIGENSPCV